MAIQEAEMKKPSTRAGTLAGRATTLPCVLVAGLRASPPARSPERQRPVADANGVATAVVAILLFAVIFSLRLASDSRETLMLLFGLPIALVTRRFGALAGFAAVGFALGLVQLRYELQGVPITPLGFMLRAVVYLSIPAAMCGGTRWREPTAPSTLVRPSNGHASNGHASNGHPPVSRSLTRRELEVLSLIALGHTNAEIADRLVVSVRTVESHRARIQRKLGRSGRSQLVRYALEHGLVEA
jgi:DNA-binding CsgD family transcriptional regulator